MIAIRGAASAIAEWLVPMLPAGENVVCVPRSGAMPVDAQRYFFCQGLLRAKPASEQTEDEIAESMDVNAHQVIHACDMILGANAFARICVMGSESAISGSYDGTYATAKAKLHRYVEKKRLPYPGQQLVCIAPSIIGNAGMTIRRVDLTNLEGRKARHPKRRFADAAEIARLVHYLLYEDRGYISGCVIRVHGGEPAWRG